MYSGCSEINNGSCAVYYKIWPKIFIIISLSGSFKTFLVSFKLKVKQIFTCVFLLATETNQCCAICGLLIAHKNISR